MAPKIKYFVTADYSTIDERTGKLSINGIFDTFRNSVFPFDTPKFFIIIGVYNIVSIAELILQILTPSGEKIAEAGFEMGSNSPMGTINNILEIPKLVLPEKGIYSVNILNKEDMTLIQTYELHADYPLQRIFAEGEKEEILSNPTLAKGAKLQIVCPHCNKVHNLELNLDRDKSISEGYEAFPENDVIECCDGNQIDLTGIRREIEWAFGQRLPQK